jgi:hypothetical protein
MTSIDPIVLEKVITNALRNVKKERPTQSGKNISVAKKVAKETQDKLDAKRKARNERARELRALKKVAVE